MLNFLYFVALSKYDFNERNWEGKPWFHRSYELPCLTFTICTTCAVLVFVFVNIFPAPATPSPNLFRSLRSWLFLILHAILFRAVAFGLKLEQRNFCFTQPDLREWIPLKEKKLYSYVLSFWSLPFYNVPIINLFGYPQPSNQFPQCALKAPNPFGSLNKMDFCCNLHLFVLFNSTIIIAFWKGTPSYCTIHDAVYSMSVMGF